MATRQPFTPTSSAEISYFLEQFASNCLEIDKKENILKDLAKRYEIRFKASYTDAHLYIMNKSNIMDMLIVGLPQSDKDTMVSSSRILAKVSRVADRNPQEASIIAKRKVVSTKLGRWFNKLGKFMYGDKPFLQATTKDKKRDLNDDNDEHDEETDLHALCDNFAKKAYKKYKIDKASLVKYFEIEIENENENENDEHDEPVEIYPDDTMSVASNHAIVSPANRNDSSSRNNFNINANAVQSSNSQTYNNNLFPPSQEGYSTNTYNNNYDLNNLLYDDDEQFPYDR